MAEYYEQKEEYKKLILKSVSAFNSDVSYESTLEDLGNAIKQGTERKDEHLTIDSAFRTCLREMFLALPKENKILTKDGNITKLLNVSLDIGSKIFPLSRELKEKEDGVKSAEDPKMKEKLREEHEKMRSILSIAKTPYQMLEDILEQQTVSQSEHTWKIVKSLTSKLSSESYFQKGKLQLLKICNALLKKLSKAIHTEFCGQVLMFLTSVYGTSERSALNLGGKINDANNTHFETDFPVFREAFEPELLRQFELASSVHQNNSTSKMKVSSSSSKIKEDGEEDEDQATAPPDTDDNKTGSYTTAKRFKNSKKNFQVNHELYQTFWRFQKYFTSDNKGLENREKWKSFVEQINIILNAFECFEYPKKELAQSAEQFLTARRNALQATVSQFMLDPKSSSSNSEGGGMDIGSLTNAADISEDTGCKFLTSPQLFALQLLDPALRKQVLTQVLVLMHSLRALPITLSETAQPRKFGQKDGKDKKDDRKDKSVSIYEDIKFIEKRAFALLESTPPHGTGFVKSLKSMLDRELSWLEWKKMRKCLEFERYPNAGNNAFDTGTLLRLGQGKKRPPLGGLSSGSSQPTQYITSISDDDVSNAAKTLTESAPTYEKHIEFWMDCEDPDAGIEDEYHPKHDTIYCWRARRLLAGHNLKVFEKMMDGNLQNGVGELINPSQSKSFIELTSPEVPVPEPEPEPKPKPSTKDDVKVEKDVGDNGAAGTYEANMEIEEGEEVDGQEKDRQEEDIEPTFKRQRKNHDDTTKNNELKRENSSNNGKGGNKDTKNDNSAEAKDQELEVEDDGGDGGDMDISADGASKDGDTTASVAGNKKKKQRQNHNNKGRKK